MAQWSYEQCHLRAPKTERSQWRAHTKGVPWGRHWWTTPVYLPRRRKTLIQNLYCLVATSFYGKGFRSQPREKIRSWSPQGSSWEYTATLWQLLRHQWNQSYKLLLFHWTFSATWRAAWEQPILHIKLPSLCALERTLQLLIQHQNNTGSSSCRWWVWAQMAQSVMPRATPDGGRGHHAPLGSYHLP